MPAYIQSTAANPVTGMFPGDEVVLFSAEAPTSPAASIAVNLPAFHVGGRSQAQLSFSIHYSASPTAVLTVQAANDDADASYINTSATSTNKQDDRIELTTSAKFVRIQLTSGSGTVTVKLYRAA